MRPAYEAESPASATPIYDALYAEYRRLFRALPGDRTGEEDLKFVGFGLRRPYGARSGEQPGADRGGHDGGGYGIPQFGAGHPHGSSVGTAGQTGVWTPVGHIPPSQGHHPGGRHRGILSLPPGRTASGSRP
ncbi:hypothetical protein [Peterkaempfera sp. SMS 1(5)a]|uniref:hypothetical protein n=1 Tax=Peterkaempfera podocarpi TaxID=3232308 RepID=UPI003670DAE0